MRYGRNKPLRFSASWAVGKQILWFALPLLLSNFFQQLYNTVDAAIVGSFVGETALAAIGSAGQLTVFLIYFFIGLSTGASICISLSFGANDKKRIFSEVHTAICLAIVSGLLLTGIGWFGAPFFLRMMHLKAEVLTYAVQYLRCYFWGMLPMMLYNMGSGILRAIGDSKTPMLCLLLSGLCNIVLDFLFVPILKGGIMGAAWATVLAQCLSAVLVLWQLCHAKGAWRLAPRRLHLQKQALWRIVRMGVPTGLQSVLVTFSNVIVQSQVNRFGLEAMAGVTAFLKIEGILYMPIEAMSLAMSNFIGRNMAQKDRKPIRTAILTGLLFILLLTFALQAVLLLQGHTILQIFSKQETVLSYGLAMLHTLVPLYFLYAINQTLVGAVRGMGNTLTPMLITLLSMCTLRLLWILVGLHFVPEIRMIFYSFPITWTATFCCLLWCAIREYRRLPMP